MGSGGHNFIDRKGEKFLTGEGYEIEIIEYFGAKNCTIRFSDNSLILKGVHYQNLKKGVLKNPYHPSVAGIGFMGIGLYSYKKNKICYNRWRQIIMRCYNIKNQKKFHHLCYRHITVVEEWLNFQNFAEWFESKYKEGFHIDKDILIKGNNVYSPETCCFVPQEINNLFVKNNLKSNALPTGVTKSGGNFCGFKKTDNTTKYLGTFKTPEEAFQAYKIAKEAHIREMADKWKDQIEIEVYKTLQDYKIEMRDLIINILI